MMNDKVIAIVRGVLSDFDPYLSGPDKTMWDRLKAEYSTRIAEKIVPLIPAEKPKTTRVK